MNSQWRSWLVLAGLVACPAGPAQSQEPAATDGRTAGWLLDLRSDDESTRLQALYGLHEVHPDAKSSARALAAVMNHKDPAVRRVVVMAIGELAAEPGVVVPVLVRALRDEDVQVARQAAAALIKIGGPAVPALAEALTDLSPLADPARIGKDGQTRALLSDYAAWALATVDAPVVPALSRVFKEVVEGERKGPRVGGKREAAPTASYLMRELTFILGKRGARDVPDLVALLADGDPEIQSLALSALGAIGRAAEAAVPGVVKVIQANDLKLSLAAVATLSRIGPPARVALGEQMRKHPDAKVRAAAARGLSYSDGASVPALVEAMLQDDSSAVRQSAAAALGESLYYRRLRETRGSSTPRTAPPRDPHADAVVLALAKALRDPDVSVRERAAYAVELVVDTPLPGVKEIVPLLIDALKVPEARVQQAAARILGAIGSAAKLAVPALIGGLKNPPEVQVAKGLSGSGPDAEFVRALGQIAEGVPEAQAILLEIIRDDKRKALHAAAMDSLGRLGSEEAVPVLTRRLMEGNEDPSQSWRKASAALLRIRPKGVGALVTILNDRSRYRVLRQRACEALANAVQPDESIAQALVPALKDPDERIRRQSALGLARKGEALAAAVPVLADALRRSRHGDWDELLDALRKLREKGTPVLLEALSQDRGIKKRTEVLRALKELEPIDPRVAPAAELLQRLAEEEAELRTAVIERLADAGVADSAVTAALLRALRDNSPAVRAAAANALGTLQPDKPADAVEALAALLKDETGPGANFSPTVREVGDGGISVRSRPVPALAAFTALKRYGPRAREAVPELVRLLTHGEAVVRRNALEVLGRVGPGAREGEMRIRTALRDQDHSVLVAASEALLAIVPDPPAAGPVALDVKIRDYTDGLIMRFLHPLADALRPSPLQSGGGAGTLPAFPWPPPRYTHIATAGTDFPRELLGDDSTSLGTIHKKLARALSEVDPHFESGLFAAPGGFVMLVRMERIDPDGAPLPGDLRWVYGTLPIQSFSDYVGRLFFEKPGYFRVIAFVITSQKNFLSSNRPLPELRSGGTELPDEVSRALFKDKTCCALIYSFERRGGGRLTFFEMLSAQIHLDKSGLLSAVARQP
jgi:HEAT repeat protein